MLLTEAEDVIMDRVRFMTDAPNVLTFDDAEDIPAPRYAFQRGTPDLSALTMDGDGMSIAEVLCRVETPEGDFGRIHSELLERLFALFPFGARFNGVAIKSLPNPRGSFSAEGLYVTPVFIRGCFLRTP
jgi:hypothetical protein